MKLEPWNRWSRVLAVALLLPVCGCISLRGMHSIPKLEGVVVDMETGEPVEGVTLASAEVTLEDVFLELVEREAA